MMPAVLDRPGSSVIDKPRVWDGSGVGFGNSQLVLYNDNHNEYGYVVGCVMSVFSHSKGVAEKITREAHEKVRAVAEVEDAEKAREHVAMLGGMGLQSEGETF